MRNHINAFLETIAVKLNPQNWKILEIGIGGDEKPSGAYKFFGQGNEWVTMDINPKWKPDIVADICNNNLLDNSYDLVIMTQTLEHIWEFRKALKEIYRLTKQYAIVDCPFKYPFHQDATKMTKPWQEWDDYIRLTPAGMLRALVEAGFQKEKIDIQFHELVVLCLMKK